MADKKANFTKSSQTLDLEKRLASGNASDRVLSTADNYTGRETPEGEGRDFTIEDNDTSGYVNVDPIYQNYANEQDKPMRSEDGVEAELEELVIDGDDANLLSPGVPSPVLKPKGSDDKEDESDKDETPKPAAKKTAQAPASTQS